MAKTIRPYTGDGVTTIYPVDFALGYINRAYVYVYLVSAEYTTQLSYTWLNNSQIEINTPVADGVEFAIRRVVPRNTLVNNYTNGAILRNSQLDNSFKQTLMALEEIEDGFAAPSGSFLYNVDVDMLGHKITNLADGVADGDAVSFGQMKEYILGINVAFGLTVRAEDAAQAAEDSETATEVLYNDFRDAYAGSGSHLPSIENDGTLWYYSGIDFTQGLYIYYNSYVDTYTGHWELVSGTGAQGATGAQGIQGNYGLTGDQGDTGPTGSQGQRGIQGALGDIGPAGIRGETGLQGPVGPQGVTGPSGDVGDQGPTGNQGPLGSVGPVGGQGDIGVSGDTGPQGSTGPTGPQGIQGVQGLVGPDGPTGSQGSQGIVGIQGPTGAIGNTGPLGPTGIQGIIGDTGLQGPTGVGDVGLTGPAGIQGVQGPAGIQGVTGTGTQGVQGVDGPAGIQGDTGIQGVGIQGIQGADGRSFDIDEIGTLTGRDAFDSATTDFVYYATDFSVTANGAADFDTFVGDGTETDFTLSYTADGAQSLHVTVAGVSQAPDKYTVAVANEVYTVTFTEAPWNTAIVNIREFSVATGYGAMYIKLSGTSGDWGPAIPFGRGPRGDQGPTGIRGPTGNQGQTGNQGVVGTQGPQGTVGSAGPTGDQGLTGTQGSIGVTGSAGPTGLQGSTGIQGTQGNQGDMGPAGPTGNTGATGPTGVQGLVGDTGPVGVTGDQGPLGAVGPQGATGSVGPQGTIGVTGNGGATGPVGSTGPTGLQGGLGPTGASGIQGPDGIVGQQGFQGDIGPQGQVGAGGERGPVGVQGEDGLVGVTGNQGAKGNVGAAGPQGSQGPVGAIGARGDTGATGPTGLRGAQGDAGVTGSQGPTGSQGINGIPLYTWQKFADNEAGTNFSNIPLTTSYWKFEAYNQTTPTASNDPTNSNWTKFPFRAVATVVLAVNGTTQINTQQLTIATLTLDVGTWNVDVTGTSGIVNPDSSRIELEIDRDGVTLNSDSNSSRANVISSDTGIVSDGTLTYTVFGNMTPYSNKSPYAYATISATKQRT